MITSVIWATVLIGGVGLFVGVFLGIAAILFKVKVDPKEEEILNALPGNNCGGCGYAGCANLAGAIASLKAPVNACPVGGEPVGRKIAEIMGVAAESQERKTAFVKCQGTCERTRMDYEYTGNEDCSMLSFVPNGGPKSCNDGCLGYGNCVKSCMFDAIHIEKGVAVVDKEKCKACGKCIAACPKHLIELIPYQAAYMVACSSKEKGTVTMKVCDTGCIGCQICKKNCPSEAIIIENNLAKIDYEKCTQCGTCVEKCPKHAIVCDMNKKNESGTEDTKSYKNECKSDKEDTKTGRNECESGKEDTE